MESILKRIQKTVQKYADIMAEVSGIDVEVADSSLYRVAGTGLYANQINQDMTGQGHVYRYVMQTGQTRVITQPGRDALCIHCSQRENCRETIEISKPIRMGSEMIGVIGLVGSTSHQRENALNGMGTYLGLLDQIAEFIAAKAGEQQETELRTSIISALDHTINHMEQGVLVLGKDGTVTTANNSARKQLKIDILEGIPVTITSTGDRINGGREYKLELEGKRYTIFGRTSDLKEPTEHFARILIFSNSHELTKKMYDMTRTDRNLELGSIIGSSSSTRRLKEEIVKIAGSTSTVLITGESGTGKEVAASAIWKMSNRKKKKFVAINCGAIPEALLEAELFGYVKGAFTGADPGGRIGKFELADQGVLFLDEIGDMPLYLQVKLLRVLQERQIVRIGSNQLIPIDVRIIAATNRDLKEMIEAKKFREDLYYRLNVIPLRIEPLRRRPDDIEDLAYFFAKRYAGKFGKEFRVITGEAMMALRTHPWYGNVRELENTMEFMVNMMEEGDLDLETLPVDFDEQKPGERQEEEYLTLKELEARAIGRALERFGTTTEGKKEAAKSLGISLATLYRKMDDFSK